ncbi:isochorismatase family protein [Arthrobacter sp. NPDC058127]|uniref:isochorismatase family protein n=1 Tax=Arthrobacter sp. NPDC058127 TaxID=3346351 RepID=UPI0036E0919A
MPITTLDTCTALIAVDLQAGIVAYPMAHAPDDVVGRAAQLAAAFRRHNLPVVLVNVAGNAPGRTDQGSGNHEVAAGWSDLVPELNQHPDDHTVTKLTWGAFHKSALDEHLRDLGVTQIVLTGIATSIGVESTARSAYEHGFNVTLAIDAMTDISGVNHLHSITNIFPMLGETGTTAEILKMLDKTRS